MRAVEMNPLNIDEQNFGFGLSLFDREASGILMDPYGGHEY